MAENQEVLERYFPKPKKERSGIAICLSGGGYRAALFHLGAFRRLNELGILSTINTITSVSGGSIIAAYLANKVRPWPPYGTAFSDWDSIVAGPFRAVTKNDICTKPFLKRLLLPWNWLNPSSQTKALERSYEKLITALNISTLPETPRFIFCATDIIFGVNWVFERDRIGDWQAGYVPPRDCPMAFAVAASSCFPPIFDPMSIPWTAGQLDDGKFPLGSKRDELISNLRLSDGGVYDNLGLEPVWKDHKTVLASDGGAPFEYEAKKNWLTRIFRCLDVAMKQSEATRKRWLIASFVKDIMEGTYWGIGSATEKYPTKIKGYSKELARDYISNIRTDLNSFSDAEAAILENHGYLLTDAAINSYAKDLVKIEAPRGIPHPEWMDEDKAREALKDSHKRITLERLLKALFG